MKNLLFIWFIALAIIASAAPRPDPDNMVLCAHTANGKTRLRLDMAKNRVVYAQYGKPIAIEFKRAFVVDNGAAGRPSGFEYIWHEKANGKTTGEYRYRLMGANFYEFRYINRRTGAITQFDNVHAVSADEDCF